MTIPLASAHAEIDEAIRKATTIWLGLDFDGTLTEHVSDPRTARLWGTNAESLSVLARSPRCRVAIITGRSIEDVHSRIDVPGLAFAGNHGLEIEQNGQRIVDPQASRLSAFLTEIVEKFRQVDWPIPVHVVNKGLTVAVDHFGSTQADAARVRSLVTSLLSSFHEISIQEGRHGLDLRPRTHAHKGTAGSELFLRQTSGQSIAIAIGDDHTDEDLFAAFPDGITIHVGQGETIARYRSTGPAEIGIWLQRLATLVTASES